MRLLWNDGVSCGMDRFGCDLKKKKKLIMLLHNKPLARYLYRTDKTTKKTTQSSLYCGIYNYIFRNRNLKRYSTANMGSFWISCFCIIFGINNQTCDIFISNMRTKWQKRCFFFKQDGTILFNTIKSKVCPTHREYPESMTFSYIDLCTKYI